MECNRWSVIRCKPLVLELVDEVRPDGHREEVLKCTIHRNKVKPDEIKTEYFYM